MEEYMDNIIGLTDEEGNESEFEILTVLEYEGKEYVALSPVEDEGQIVILQIENADTEEEMYISVDDDEELMAVYALLKEQLKDEYDFVD